MCSSSRLQGTDDYSVLNKEFRKCMARVSETIPVLFVPGENDVGAQPTPQSIARYHAQFGCDFFGFWFGGNSLFVFVLIVDPLVWDCFVIIFGLMMRS
jgi:hypothetical protein